MKKMISQKIISVITVLVLLSVTLFGTFSLTAAAEERKRTVSVNTSSVIQEDFWGNGNNLWTYSYYAGMNDAYNLINVNRTDINQPKIMRMMFMPQWLTYTDRTPEEQQAAWEAGDYKWDSVDTVNFFKKVKMYQESGTVVQFNMGGRCSKDTKMNEWFPVKDSFVVFNGTQQEAKTRGAPANLKAFAKATAAVFVKAKSMGITNMTRLSFYNEVAYFTFEAFFDKRVYWVEMIKLVHEELKAAGFRNKGTEDYVYIDGTESAGFISDSMISDFHDYIYEHLRDENGDPIFDTISNHQYMVVTIEKYKKDSEDIVKRYSDTPIFNTEGAGKSQQANSDNTNGEYNLSYGVNDSSVCLMIANGGFAGNALWYESAEYLGDPFYLEQSGRKMCNWEFPTRGTFDVGENNAQRGLFYRYVDAHSKVYKTASSDDDIYAASFANKDNKYSVFAEFDYGKSGVSREITVEFTGNNVPADGTVFERHIYVFPDKKEGQDLPDSDDPSYYRDADGNTVGGGNAIIPVTDKKLTVSNGKIVDNEIGDKHYLVLYTMLDEQTQIEVNTNTQTVDYRANKTTKQGTFEGIEFPTAPNGTTELSVRKIYGSNCSLNDIKWEIVGKNPAALNYYNSTYNEQTGLGGGYGMTTENCGTLSTNAGGSVIYTASNTEIGDTVAIKAYLNSDPDSYRIIIIPIGYSVTFESNNGESAFTKAYAVGEYEVYLPTPEKDGKVFEGWYDNSSFTGDKYEKSDKEKLSGGKTLYAKWSA